MDWFEEEAKFSSSSFNAKHYVHDLFLEETLEEAEAIRSDLQAKQSETRSDLINIVKKNYFKFLDAAKESAEVEQQLSGLRSNFAELHNQLGALKNVNFGFEGRALGRGSGRDGSSQDEKEASAWKQRVQYVAEAELELDVMLSERRLESAVALLEQARGPLEVVRRGVVSEHIASESDRQTLARVESRIAQVADALTMQLTSPAISAGEARIVFGLLKRMHLEAKAKEVFLSGKSQHIAAGIRQLKPDADRIAFVRALSHQVFCALRDACGDYLQCFGEAPSSLSFLFVWCQKEVLTFGTLWIRFVISRGEFECVVIPCLAEALAGVRILHQFGFFLERPLKNQLLNAVVEKYETSVKNNIEHKLQEKLAAEDWYASAAGSVLPALGNKNWLLTPSAIFLIKATYAFFADSLTILPPDLTLSMSKICFSLLENYVAALKTRLEAPLNDQQLLGLFGNVICIVSVLGKELDGVLRSKNLKPTFGTLLGELFSQFCLKLCARKANFLLVRSWQFSYKQYVDIRASPSSSSRQVLKLFDWLKTFRQRLIQQIRAVADNAEQICNSVLTQLLLDIVDLIRNSDFWENSASFSREAVIQFVLDMRWIQEASEFMGLSTPKLMRDLEACVQRAVLEHCALIGEKNPKLFLPQGSFFDEILEKQMSGLREEKR